MFLIIIKWGTHTYTHTTHLLARTPARGVCSGSPGRSPAASPQRHWAGGPLQARSAAAAASAPTAHGAPAGSSGRRKGQHSATCCLAVWLLWAEHRLNACLLAHLCSQPSCRVATVGRQASECVCSQPSCCMANTGILQLQQVWHLEGQGTDTSSSLSRSSVHSK